MSFLSIKNVKKIYHTRKREADTLALQDVSFEVKEKEFVAIMGESGSGKSTLLNIIATLDQATEGQVLLNGINFDRLREKEVSAFRRDNLGFVFQDFNVLNTFNNKDNILLPLVLSQKKKEEMDRKLKEVAKLLDIEEILNKFPYEISGGQKQRVAIARAIITDPQILLADEPTGALDSKTSEKILELFQKLNENGQTILMVTHSIKAASMAGRVLFIKDGIVFHEIYRGGRSNLDFAEKIAQSLTMINGGQ